MTSDQPPALPPGLDVNIVAKEVLLLRGANTPVQPRGSGDVDGAQTVARAVNVAISIANPFEVTVSKVRRPASWRGLFVWLVRNNSCSQQPSG